MTDYELAKILFTYDEEVRGVRWRVGRGTMRAGEVAGGNNKLGYFRINLNGKLRLRSHIVWLLHKGVWPNGQIDHINRDSTDDRITNLREVTQTLNQQNQIGPKHGNRSGYRGVSLDNGKYRATITVNRRQTHLGTFRTAEQAHAAYLEAKVVYHKGAVL